MFIYGFEEVSNNYIKKASYNLFFQPKADIRQKLSELNIGDHDGLKALKDSTTINDNYEVFFTGKSSADFNDPAICKELVVYFVVVKFPSALVASKFGAKIPCQLYLSKEIFFTFTKALREVFSDFHNNRTTPLLRLLKKQSGSIDRTAFKPNNEPVEQLNSKIESLDLFLEEPDEDY